MISWVGDVTGVYIAGDHCTSYFILNFVLIKYSCNILIDNDNFTGFGGYDFIGTSIVSFIYMYYKSHDSLIPILHSWVRVTHSYIYIVYSVVGSTLHIVTNIFVFEMLGVHEMKELNYKF